VSGDQGYCAPHHQGPYCGGCTSGYVMQDNGCVSCESLSDSNKSLFVVLIGLALLVALFAAYRTHPPLRAAISKLNTKSMVTKAKHIFVFFQAVILVSDVYSVPYPTSYLKFLDVFLLGLI
jgi:hypothetical protein